MTINKYQRERFADPDIEKSQDRLQDFTKQFEQSQILSGRLIKDVAISSASTTEISHGLGRAPVGVILVKTSAQVDFWEPTAADNFFIYARTSVSGIFNLWVF